MSVTSSRTVQIGFSGDETGQIIQSALDNIYSFGQIDNVTLAIGNNTITAPVSVNSLVTGLTIIPPAGNTTLITLKGVGGDTGIPLHKTDPTSISLDTTFLTLVLSVTVAIVGVRLVWT